MTVLLWIIIFLMTGLTLAYRRASLLVATLTLGLLLAAFTMTTSSPLAGIIIWAIFAAYASLLHISPIRKALITRPLLALSRRRLPTLSPAEQGSLSAGTRGWETELFSICPNWRRLENLPPPMLSTAETDFLDGPVQQLLSLCQQSPDRYGPADLPRAIIQHLYTHKFPGLSIDTEQGGLGFSHYMTSCILARIASAASQHAYQAIAAISTAQGPAYLLAHYATTQQRDYYLPRIANGQEVPSLATSQLLAEANSEVFEDHAVVGHGQWHGESRLGLTLNWDRHALAMARSATLIGLFVRTTDPEGLLGEPGELGLSCILLPTDLSGCHMDCHNTHHQITCQNGLCWGRDVFVPLDYILGGTDMIGQGQRMLVESLALEHSLITTATATGQSIANTRLASAYAITRHQAGMALSDFDGPGQALGGMGARAYANEALRRFGANALDMGELPITAAALTHHHTQTMAGTVANTTLDILIDPAIHGAHATQSLQAPSSCASNEHASLFLRSMNYGHSLFRCHPYLLHEIEIADNRNQAAAIRQFDQVVFAHIGHSLSAAARSLIMGFTGGLGSRTGKRGSIAVYYQNMNRYAANLALLADVVLGTLGGQIRSHPALCARLGDMLAGLHTASAALARFSQDEATQEDLPFVAWICEQAFTDIEEAIAGILRHLPNRPMALLVGALVFPLARTARVPSDGLNRHLARLLQNSGPARERLLPNCAIANQADHRMLQFELAMTASLETAQLRQRVLKARHDGQIAGPGFWALITQAEYEDILSPEEATALREAHDRQMHMLYGQSYEAPDHAPA